MPVFLLDTSVLIDMLNSNRNRAAQLRLLVERGHDLASCPITIAEVIAGMHPGEEAETETLLNRLRFYPISREVATLAGRMKYAWARKGVTLSLSDTLIAATAVHYDLVCITDNRRHFPMPELVLYDLDGPQV